MAAIAATNLEKQLTLPKLFAHKGIDEFRGSDDDTVNITVPGIVETARSYGWRNDRSTEILFDEYAERKVAVKFGGDVYSAVKLIDEQVEMDGLTPGGKLAVAQTDAIARRLNREAANYLQASVPWSVTVGISAENSDSLRNGLIEIDRVASALNFGQAQRPQLLVGAGIYAALLRDKLISSASEAGERRAVAALERATVGTLFNMDIVKTPELATDEAYLITSNAVAIATAAPVVPASIEFGATASAGDWAVRWLRQYDVRKFQDQSVFNLYRGFQYVDDPLIYENGTVGGNPTWKASEYNHFVRGLKVKLFTTEALAVSGSSYPDADKTGSTDAIKKERELAKATGLDTRAAYNAV
ncbi:hypothetical protein [Salana multivorans]|nr:hypothetical protein [Salana multivorans]